VLHSKPGDIFVFNCPSERSERVTPLGDLVQQKCNLKNTLYVGGPGLIVEIDESKFGRRKYHRGHRVEGQWVFGGVERGTGRCFLVPVEKRDKDTLLTIIKEWILPGTLIISDCWKVNSCFN